MNVLTELAAALERFNRKERNLLIRSVLGHGETPLQLSEAFRQLLASTLNIPELPKTTWWATDYHASWIAGAIAIYMDDKVALEIGRPNPEFKGRRLVEGNQEDIDLLVAVGQHLIMIEAKAYGAWNAKQIVSKLRRIDLLLAYYEQVKQQDAPIHFHFLLMSPRKPCLLPDKLKKDMPARVGRLWPQLPWIQLKLETSVLEVTRCEPDGTSSAHGNHWCVVRSSNSQPKRTNACSDSGPDNTQPDVVSDL